MTSSEFMVQQLCLLLGRCERFLFPIANVFFCFIYVTLFGLVLTFDYCNCVWNKTIMCCFFGKIVFYDNLFNGKRVDEVLDSFQDPFDFELVLKFFVSCLALLINRRNCFLQLWTMTWFDDFVQTQLALLWTGKSISVWLRNSKSKLSICK